MQYVLKKMKDKRKDYFLPGTFILHQAEMTNVKVLSTVGPQSSQNLGIISHTKPNLVNQDLMPHLAQWSCHCWKYLFWPDCGTFCCILLNLFYGSETMALQPNFEAQKTPEFAERYLEDTVDKIWLKFGISPKNVGLRGRSDKVHCHGTSFDCFSIFPAFHVAQYEI
jgi:hypothetical protein